MISKVAERIVRQNLSVREGETVIISAGPRSLEFAEELAFHTSMVGAHPTIHYSSEKLMLRVLKNAKLKYLKTVPKLTDYLSRNADVEIIIDDSDPFIENKFPQRRLEIRRKALKPVRDRIDRRIIRKTIKMALVGFPTEAQARALGRDFRTLSKIFWRTMNVDYEKLHEFNESLARKFSAGTKVRIVGEGTDLEFSIRGRKPILDSGLWEKERLGFLNLPAGEVFFAPVETSAEGTIHFNLPCLWHYGKKVEGVTFTFRKGRVVDYRIEKGKKAFEDVIKNASGDKLRIGEFGIGTNPAARFTGGMVIVDEKIKGTIHIAIGSNKGYGGKNDSTIHWDFFRDMKDGEVYLDGELVMKRGKLL